MGRPITIMTLLKVLYFAHAWHLAKFDRPLIAQPFSAWKYGPVCRVVYDQFKDYGSRYIDKKCVSFDVNTNDFSETTLNFDQVTELFLENIFDYYSQFHPFRLSDLTHETGGPWDMVWKEAENRAIPGMIIKNELIKRWFRLGGGETKAAANHRRLV
jgi:uncharacterized phage-associated protein